MTEALVAVFMGSKSDASVMQGCLDMLERLGVPSETHVVSAHRKPDKVREIAQTAQARGIEVLIAGAGLSAALPGVLASWTNLPVIGIPLAAGDLRGMDALLSIVQMPPGIPVACVAIGEPGARNAAVLAARILALKHEDVATRLQAYRDELAAS